METEKYIILPKNVGKRPSVQIVGNVDVKNFSYFQISIESVFNKVFWDIDNL